jgi:orotate phosphoribosyltransferase
LIDDVRTTGATLLEAASSLELRGHTVKTLTLAWSPHETSETNHAARRDHERPPV